MIVSTVMILTKLLNHGVKISATVALDDLLATLEQAVFYELRAVAGPPSGTADVAELRFAQAARKTLAHDKFGRIRGRLHHVIAANA